MIECALEVPTVNFFSKLFSKASAKGNPAAHSTRITRAITTEASKCVADAAAMLGPLPLHDAATNGDSERAASLLGDNPALIRSKDSHGRTALHSAVYAGNQDVARLLLASGADANAKDDMGTTPLHSAASNGNSDLVKLLLQSEADVNAENDEGDKPLQWAAAMRRWDVVDLLRRHGSRE